MGQEPDSTTLARLLELKTLLEEEWPARSAALHASGVPLMEGDDTDDDTDDQGNQDDGDDDTNDDETQTFSAEYVKKLRAEAARNRREAREAQARAKAYEDRDKTEAEKLEERAQSAETKADAASREAARLRVALNKGLTAAQAKRLIGDSEEELEQDADELLASFTTTDDDDGSQGLQRRPRERLRPGAAPSAEPEETDPRALAAKVPRRF